MTDQTTPIWGYHVLMSGCGITVDDFAITVAKDGTVRLDDGAQCFDMTPRQAFFVYKAIYSASVVGRERMEDASGGEG